MATIQCCSTFALGSRNRIHIFQEPIDRYRFSAFWLRSKCSICSYQLNIWYVLHRRTTILNWFLELGEVSGACSAFATGWPGIAVPPGPAHSPRGFINTVIFFSLSLFQQHVSQSHGCEHAHHVSQSHGFEHAVGAVLSIDWLTMSSNQMAVKVLTFSAIGFAQQPITLNSHNIQSQYCSKLQDSVYN